MTLLLFLGAVGATIIFVVSKAAAPVRNLWPDLLSCALCSGFWIGLGVGTVEYAELSFWTWGGHAVLYGCSVSVVSYTLYAVLYKLGLP